MLDHVLYLLEQSPNHVNFNIKNVNDRIIPPLYLNQHVGFIEDGLLVAWASWAFMSRDKADIFLDGQLDVRPDDWSSGDVPVFMDFVAPYGHARKLYRKCRDLFPDIAKAEWRRHTKNKRVGVVLNV